jgi:hypothetical protein
MLARGTEVLVVASHPPSGFLRVLAGQRSGSKKREAAPPPRAFGAARPDPKTPPPAEGLRLIRSVPEAHGPGRPRNWLPLGRLPLPRGNTTRSSPVRTRWSARSRAFRLAFIDA